MCRRKFYEATSGIDSACGDTNPVLLGGIGEMNFGKQSRQGNRVYDSNAVAICLLSQPVGKSGGNSYLYAVGAAMRGRYNNDNTTSQQIETRADEISNTLTTVQKDSLIVEAKQILPAVLKYQRTEYAKKIRRDYESGKVKERRCNMREYTLRSDGLSNTITTVTKDNYVVESKQLKI